jgi:hypothetical protein
LTSDFEITLSFGQKSASSRQNHLFCFAILNLYYNAAYRTLGFSSQALNISAYFPAYLAFGVAACLALHAAYLALGIATHHWSYLLIPCVTFYYF